MRTGKYFDHYRQKKEQKRNKVLTRVGLSLILIILYFVFLFNEEYIVFSFFLGFLGFFSFLISTHEVKWSDVFLNSKIFINPYYEKLKRTPSVNGTPYNILRKAELLEKMGKEEDAYLLILKALENEPGEELLRKKEVQIALELEKIPKDERDKLVLDYQEDFPENASSLFLDLTHKSLKDNDNKTAQKTIEKALKSDPQNAEAFGMASIVAFNDSKYKKAIELADRSVELNPWNTNGRLAQKYLAEKYKVHDEALRIAEEFYFENPSHENLLMLSDNLVINREPERAIALLKEGLSEFPESKKIKAKIIKTKSINTPLYRILYGLNASLYYRKEAPFLLKFLLSASFTIMIFGRIIDNNNFSVSIGIYGVVGLLLTIGFLILNYMVLGLLEHFYLSKLKKN